MELPAPKARIALTGATGYVGGRLRPRLEALGHPVRSLCRRPEFLRGSVSSTSEAIRGDIRDADAVRQLVRGADVAFYLVQDRKSVV